MLRVTVNEAQQVFNNHLFSESWDSASSTTKEKAVAHASRDIGALNYNPNTPRNLLIAAVCEQVLLLLNMTGADRERVKVMATGVKQRGVEGAFEWYWDDKPAKIISPDALALLDGYIHRKFGHIR